ncbi:MAG: hypothetical protein ACLPX9_18425, partial [Rhodomicrobium sp.]
IQSYFHGCFIEGSDRLRAKEFEDVYGFLPGFLGTKTETDMAELPASVSEAEQLRLLHANPDVPPLGISALKGKLSARKAVITPAGLERLKAPPQHGPILTII